MKKIIVLMILCVFACSAKSAAVKHNISSETVDNTSSLDGGNENQCMPTYCPVK